MQIPVLIEPVAGNGYRARSGEPFAVTTEGGTRDEVLTKLNELVKRKISSGGEIVSLEVPIQHPLMRWTGTLDLNDPIVKEWMQIMEENRKRDDEELEVPTPENPWLKLEGIYKDDPLFDDWQRAIEDYRRQVDEDPDAI